MAECPACHRPVALARPRCLYCDHALPEDRVPAVSKTAEPAPALPVGEAPAGVLLILDLRTAQPTEVGAALGLSLYDAVQRVRRGGYQLLRVAPRAEATREAERLTAAGLRVVSLAEAPVRAAAAEPLLISSGWLEAGPSLRLRGPGEPIRVGPEDVALVVRGPIQRNYSGEGPRIRRGLFELGSRYGLPGLEVATATLEPGYRYHLHLRQGARPLELDPAAFNLIEPTEGEVALQNRLAPILERVWGAAPVDDEFRNLPPALAPAEREPVMNQLKAGGPARPRPAGQRVVLDNLAQFRFYSAWRAAVERSPGGPDRG